MVQAETSMVQKQRSSVLEANNAKSEAANSFGDYCFIMRSTMNEGLLKGKLERGDRERAKLHTDTLGLLEKINWWLRLQHQSSNHG